jgi:hypothetical protein
MAEPDTTMIEEHNGRELWLAVISIGVALMIWLGINFTSTFAMFDYQVLSSND